jgi:hypothetical protein
MGALGRTYGELNRELLNLISVERNWIKISEKLLDNFSSPMGYRSLIYQFVMRHQLQFESPIEYLESIIDAYTLFYGELDERLVIEIVMSGMNPQTRFNIFRYGVPENVETLKRELSLFQRMERSAGVYESLIKQSFSKSKDGFGKLDTEGGMANRNRSGAGSRPVRQCLVNRLNSGNFQCNSNLCDAGDVSQNRTLENTDGKNLKEPVAVFLD